MRSALLSLLSVLLPGLAAAQSYEPSVGPSVLMGVSFEQLMISGAGERSESLPGMVVDIAAGLPLGDDGLSSFLGLRVGMDENQATRLASQLFLRASAGDESWKTFFDAGILTRFIPSWSVGARVGIGLQHDFTESAGVVFTAGGSAGYGSRFQVGLDAGLAFLYRFGAASHSPREWYVH